jgi:hypothetical protein
VVKLQKLKMPVIAGGKGFTVNVVVVKHPVGAV